ELATKDGITKHYDYDEQGRTTFVTREMAGQLPQTLARYEYTNDIDLKPSAVIRPSINPQGEHRLDNRYNRQGQPTQLTERGYRPEADGSFSPIQRTTRLSYNEAGQLSQIDGPREDVEDSIQLDYDNQQRLKQLKTPDGRTLSVTQYDTYGRPQQIRASGQADLTLAYNSRGKVTQVSQGQQTVRYDYDATGHLTGITDPNGKQITLNYDQAGRATGLEDSLGNRLEQALDTEGRLTQRRLMDAQGQLLATVSYLYDAQGRLSARQTPRGQTHYRYDDAGNLTEVQDPQGHATALDYNGLGQLLAVTQPGNRVTQLHYDEHGRASGLTDPRENTTDLIKDDFGNLIRQRHPDTGEVRYAYDRAGNHIQKIDAQGVITSYRFDAANRLIEETTPSGTTSLDYDPNTGRLAQLTDDNSHEGFAYDDQGRLIQHSRHIDGHRFITGYAYNAQGKLSQKTLPDGQVLSYHYYREGNQKGQLRAITRKSLMGLKADTLVGEIDQDASDGTTGLTFGNGLRETRHHDKLGRTTAIDHSRRLKLSYEYDAQGRITGIDYNGLLQNYDYDLLGRLIQAETQLGSYRYDYDSLGNRTQKQHTDPAGNTITQENHYPNPGEGNRLLSQQNGELESYQYNPAGSPEQIGERYFEYDDHQRPVRLYRVDSEHPDNKTLVAAYAYNRFGERIKKVVFTNSKRPKVTYYLYDGHQLTAEADESGKVTAQYLYQQQRPILKLEGKTAYAIHTDHLGAPRAVTDEKQQTVWSADYSPFGLIDIQTQQITLNLRLPGQYEDQESGTYYNYQRDYDPNTGRYLTSDPIGLKGGLNTYAYVGGDPLNTIDPLGLYWEIVNGIPQWVPEGPDGSTEPVNIFDLYPMPGTPAIDVGELTDYLSTLEREEYGDRLIDDFASTGAPDICIRDVSVPEEFQFGLGNLRGGTGLPGIIYGDTIDGVLAQYTDQPFNMGSIHGWVRNGNQLQLHYPGLSDTQVDVVGIAIGHLPAYGGERMHIAIPAGASDEQIAEELMMSLGSLLTHEDVVAFLANLPQERNEPLLVDIYELYQEILARYQTRLHSDERVWHAEIDANRNQEALNAHIQEHGETLDCSGRVQTTDAAVCQRRAIVERDAEEAMERYIEAMQTVNNEMIDNGMMPLMDEEMSNQSEAREMFAATTIAAVGIFVPLTLQDAAIDAMTVGLGRIRRVGDALEDMLRVVRGAGHAALSRVRNITDETYERVWRTRSNNFYEPRAWRQNYEDFYGGNVTSTTIPPYSAPRVSLAGQRHPVTGIVYDNRGFPIFDDVAFYDTRLNINEFRSVSYQSQMRMATRDLRDQLNNNPQLRSMFEPDQLQAIQSGQANIPRLTWHHHQDTGRMQLIPQDIHRRTGHVGGEAISGGL
ncbi:MAG: HNH endonuclease, partial [Candidatus Thiodiazotropha sp.]